MKSLDQLIKKINSKEHRVLMLIIVIFFTIFLTISFHRYWQYSTWYYDFGIYYTAISSVAQLREPIIDHLRLSDQNILGDHFNPIIFLISPFVAVVQRGEVLLFFQTLFVSLSGIFVFKMSKLFQKNRFEAFAMLIIYFSFIGLHNALITEFHPITLLPLPLSMFFYGMVKKNQLWFYVGLVFVLLTKESTFIIPAWFSLLLIINNKDKWRKIGIFTLIFSVAYGLFLLQFVFKYFNGVGYFYVNEALDNKNGFLPEISKLKIQTIFYSFANFGFFPLLAPETLLPIFFNWWSRFSSEAATRHDLGMHYNAEIVPTFILATNIGWLRFKKIIVKFTPSFKEYYFKWVLFTIVSIIAVLNVYILKSPVLLFGIDGFYENTKNFEFLDRLIEHIPDDGIVMAQTNIAAKIAYRKVYILRGNYQDYPQKYIVVDFRDGQEPNNFYGVGSFKDFTDKITNDRKYEVFYDQGEQKIYRKIED